MVSSLMKNKSVGDDAFVNCPSLRSIEVDIIIRLAHRKEAQQIAELFMLAWPVDEILESYVRL